jgi:hypothetical protein
MGVYIEMNRLRNDVVLIFVIDVATMLLTLAVVKTRTSMLTEDARAIRLEAGCELWDIQPPAQPTRTLVLTCPKTDMIGLLPLPVNSRGLIMGGSRQIKKFLSSESPIE